MSDYVLMSVRAAYADAIHASPPEKTTEFRLRPPKQGARILTYRSGAHKLQRGILGAWTAGRVKKRWPYQHLLACDKPGIGLSALVDYAGGAANLVAGIDVTDVATFPGLVPLQRIGVVVPPQSWIHLTEDQYRTALAAAGVPA